MADPLKPLPYHVTIADHLRDEEPTLWQWFSSDQLSAHSAEMLQLELLKSNYRLPIAANEAVYALAGDAAQKLGLELPLTLYQSQSAETSTNAAIAFLPDQLVIILLGDIRSLLNDQEMTAVFGHEMAHHILFSEEDGRYLTATRLLNWCAEQPRCETSLLETDRLFRLNTELFADIGGLRATNDPDAVISSLIKVSTGLKQVDAQKYVEQADEVIKKLHGGSAGITHPELYIRAKSTSIIAKGGESPSIVSDLLAGPLNVKLLDITGQKKLTALTERVIQELTKYSEFDNERAENLALRYFPSNSKRQLNIDSEHADVETAMKDLAPSTQEYLSYVILDFATVDPDSYDIALARSLDFANTFTIGETYEQILRKELKLTKPNLVKMKKVSAQLNKVDRNA
jgi:Peptidase family M48